MSRSDISLRGKWQASDGEHNPGPLARAIGEEPKSVPERTRAYRRGLAVD